MLYFYNKEFSDPPILNNSIQSNLISIFEIQESKYNLDSIILHPIFSSCSEVKKESLNNGLFLVIRRIPKELKKLNGYPLKTNDILKLGKIVILVKKFHHSNGWEESIQDQSSSNDIFSEKVPQEDSDNNSNKSKICRFCFCEGETDRENPLISPCLCTGSMKYIHLECLRTWIQTKPILKSNNHCVTIVLSHFKCDICKSPFPQKVTRSGKFYKILKIKKPLIPRIKFEIYDNEDGFKLIEITFTSFALKKELLLGRSHLCDFQIEDISVSRFHAKLNYAENQFCIEDVESKFGTLLYVKHPMILNDTQNITFQVGRTVFKTRVRIQQKLLMGENMRQDSRKTLQGSQKVFSDEKIEEEVNKSCPWISVQSIVNPRLNVSISNSNNKQFPLEFTGPIKESTMIQSFNSSNFSCLVNNKFGISQSKAITNIVDYYKPLALKGDQKLVDFPEGE